MVIEMLRRQVQQDQVLELKPADALLVNPVGADLNECIPTILILDLGQQGMQLNGFRSGSVSR